MLDTVEDGTLVVGDTLEQVHGAVWDGRPEEGKIIVLN